MPDIACPACAGHPDKSELWRCTCGYVWNTFTTGGKCPGCAKKWADTQCPSCHAWSPHADWYRDAQNLLNDLLPGQGPERSP